jgi:hypothetical protein
MTSKRSSALSIRAVIPGWRGRVDQGPQGGQSGGARRRVSRRVIRVATRLADRGDPRWHPATLA